MIAAVRRVVIMAAGALTTVACSTGVGETRTRELVATLQSPNGAEGAVVLELSGTAILNVTMVGGEVFAFDAGATTRVVAVLETAGSIQFTVVVDEDDDAPDARILEVAGGDDALRESVDGYVVEFRP